MNRIAMIIGVTGFFAVAIVAWLGGCTPFRCATRALLGDVVTYLGVRFSLKLIVNIIADAFVKARISRNQRDEKLNL